MAMKTHPITILLAAAIAIHAMLGGVGGMGGMAVVCLGDGHRHTQAEEAPCASACDHGTPLPMPSDVHGHECDCTDIEISITDLVSPTRGHVAEPLVLCPTASAAWSLVLVDSGLGRRGPPMPRPWFDPGGRSRLASLACVRLII